MLACAVSKATTAASNSQAINANRVISTAQRTSAHLNSHGPIKRKNCFPAPAGKVTVSLPPLCTSALGTLVHDAGARLAVDCS